MPFLLDKTKKGGKEYCKEWTVGMMASVTEAMETHEALIATQHEKH